MGTGECAPFMAKQFGVDQLKRDGSAVDRNKGRVLSFAEGMDRTCEEFLTGSATFFL